MKWLFFLVLLLNHQVFAKNISYIILDPEHLLTAEHRGEINNFFSHIDTDIQYFFYLFENINEQKLTEKGQSLVSKKSNSIVILFSIENAKSSVLLTEDLKNKVSHFKLQKLQELVIHPHLRQENLSFAIIDTTKNFIELLKDDQYFPEQLTNQFLSQEWFFYNDGGYIPALGIIFWIYYLFFLLGLPYLRYRHYLKRAEKLEKLYPQYLRKNDPYLKLDYFNNIGLKEHEKKWGVIYDIFRTIFFMINPGIFIYIIGSIQIIIYVTLPIAVFVGFYLIKRMKNKANRYNSIGLYKEFLKTHSLE